MYGFLRTSELSVYEKGRYIYWMLKAWNKLSNALSSRFELVYGFSNPRLTLMLFRAQSTAEGPLDDIKVIHRFLVKVHWKCHLLVHTCSLSERFSCQYCLAVLRVYWRLSCEFSIDCSVIQQASNDMSSWNVWRNEQGLVKANKDADAGLLYERNAKRSASWNIAHHRVLLFPFSRKSGEGQSCVGRPRRNLAKKRLLILQFHARALLPCWRWAFAFPFQVPEKNGASKKFTHYRSQLQRWRHRRGRRARIARLLFYTMDGQG